MPKTQQPKILTLLRAKYAHNPAMFEAARDAVNMVVGAMNESVGTEPPTWLEAQIARLPDMREAIMSDDMPTRIRGVEDIRNVLATEDPPIAEVVALGIVPRLVQFLCSDDDNLVYKSLWALENIAAGSSEQTEAVVSGGAVARFIQLLGHRSAEIQADAALALANVVVDRIEFRDMALALGAVKALVQCVTPSMDNSQLTYAVARALAVIIDNGEPPPIEQIYIMIPTLYDLLFSRHTEALVNACNALCHLSGNPTTSIIDKMIQSGVARRMVDFLDHHDDNIKIRALKVLGNIACGDYGQTQNLINYGVLPALNKILDNNIAEVRKQSVWVVSNIASNYERHIELVFDAGIFSKVKDRLENDDSDDVKTECAWAVCNVIVVGANVRVRAVMDTVPHLCAMLLNCDDPPTTRHILDALSVAARIDRASVAEHINLIFQACKTFDDDMARDKALAVITELIKNKI